MPLAFRHPVIHELQDCQQNWEQLSSLIAVSPNGKIEGVQGPEGRAFNTAVAMAYRSAEQKIPSGVVTRVKLDKAIKDPGSRLELTNGYYVAASTGYYSVAGSIDISTKANTGIVPIIQVNEVIKILGGLGVFTSETNVFAAVAGIVYVEAGQHIELAVEQTTGEERKLTLAEYSNRLSVMRVGEGPPGPIGPEGPGGKEYKAKAAGGLELGGVGSNEFAVKAEGVTNAMIKAAAGIEDSKLALSTVVKLAGAQEITGAKTFSAGIAGTEDHMGIIKAIKLLATQSMLKLGTSVIEPFEENDNYKPAEGGVVYFVTEEATPVTFSGWVPFEEIGGRDGVLLVVFNNNSVASKQVVKLLNESAKSEAKNQFALAFAELILEPQAAGVFVYRGTKWHLIAFAPNAWKTEAAVEHAAATYEIEPSKGRNTDVLVRAVGKAVELKTKYNVIVGGTTVTEIVVPKLAETIDISITVPVPAGAKLKVEKVEGALEKSFTQITLK